VKHHIALGGDKINTVFRIGVFIMSETQNEAQAGGQEPGSNVNISQRSLKSLKIVLDGRIEMLPRWGAKVASSNGNGKTYTVTEDFCTCPDYQFRRGNVCKHIRAFRVMLSLSTAEEQSDQP